jgi:hypothetical protein
MNMTIKLLRAGWLLACLASFGCAGGTDGSDEGEIGATESDLNNPECSESCQTSSDACYVNASSDAQVCYCDQDTAACFARCAGRRPPPRYYCNE